jgi:hypothetical protein
MLRKTLLLIALLLPLPLYAENISAIQSNEVIVLFEDPLRNSANAVLKIYPIVKTELENTLGWKLNFRPEIHLIRDRQDFRKIIDSNLTVAFAVPQKYLIVIDNSRMHTKPFTLETTLKHELCHLLLNNYIKKENLPRWLNEGVCQWTSGGIAEIITDRKNLTKAYLSKRMISINSLQKFPHDEKSMLLAYEESKSLIEYIVDEFGRQKLLDILDYLREGLSPDEAVRKSLSISIYELETKWHAYLKRRITWLTYLSNNIHTILFLFAALITVAGFIRVLRRKRAYRDEEDGL